MFRKVANLNKRLGQSQFTPLANNMFMLQEPTKIQTDGSYNLGISRTAVILNKPDDANFSIYKTYFSILDKHESEWCSVLDGLEYAIKKQSKTVMLENSDTDVINMLIYKQKPNEAYMDYYSYILNLVKNFDYLAMRPISRRLNKADKLFRV